MTEPFQLVKKTQLGNSNASNRYDVTKLYPFSVNLYNTKPPSMSSNKHCVIITILHKHIELSNLQTLTQSNKKKILRDIFVELVKGKQDQIKNEAFYSFKKNKVKAFNKVKIINKVVYLIFQIQNN